MATEKNMLDGDLDNYKELLEFEQNEKAKLSKEISERLTVIESQQDKQNEGRFTTPAGKNGSTEYGSIFTSPAGKSASVDSRGIFTSPTGRFEVK